MIPGQRPKKPKYTKREKHLLLVLIASGSPKQGKR